MIKKLFKNPFGKKTKEEPKEEPKELTEKKKRREEIINSLETSKQKVITDKEGLTKYLMKIYNSHPEDSSIYNDSMITVYRDKLKKLNDIINFITDNPNNIVDSTLTLKEIIEQNKEKLINKSIKIQLIVGLLEYKYKLNPIFDLYSEKKSIGDDYEYKLKLSNKEKDDRDILVRINDPYDSETSFFQIINEEEQPKQEEQTPITSTGGKKSRKQRRRQQKTRKHRKSRRHKLR